MKIKIENYLLLQLSYYFKLKIRYRYFNLAVGNRYAILTLAMGFGW